VFEAIVSVLERVHQHLRGNSIFERKRFNSQGLIRDQKTEDGFEKGSIHLNSLLPSLETARTKRRTIITHTKRCFGLTNKYIFL